MMTNVPHVTSGSGLRKFQADGFLLDRVYNFLITCVTFSIIQTNKCMQLYYI